MARSKTPVQKSKLITPKAQHPRAVKICRIWHRRVRERLLSLLLMTQIFSLFILPSARAAGIPIPSFVFVVVLLLFAALAIIVARRFSAFLALFISVALTIGGAIWHHEQPDLITDAAATLGQVMTQASLLWVISTAVFGPGRTTHHRILGGVVMYLSIGMVFIALDIFLARTVPDAFSNLPSDSFELREALTYFSFSTLTTGSFGDIIPLHPIARSLANLESIAGQLFPATLLARIVSLHSSSKSA